MKAPKGKPGRKSTFNEKDAAEIYGLSDESGLRYIGKANDSAKRFKGHMRDARRRRTPVYDWINHLAAKGQSPRLDVLEITTQAEWPDAERRHIAAARAKGSRLLNLADGGDQPGCSIETRRANAVELNRRMDADSELRKIWMWKRQIGDGLRRGQIRNATRAKLREVGRLLPSQFGAWASIPDRMESANGEAI